MAESSDQLLSPREEGLRRLLADIELFSRHVVGVPLRPYQLEPARAILDSVLHHRGRTFTVMMSRQAGKNELSAQLEAYLLNLFQRTGGVVVKAAPTFRPQIVNSILRLERTLENGLNRGRWTRQLGSMIQLGRARVSFFSGEPESHVVGATASLLLEVDEAQDFDEEKYLKDFRPMGATTNVTTVLYGTAWTADTLLERARRENVRLEAADGERRDFRYPWYVVAAHNPDYRAYVEAEMARMGPEHPLVRTQYLLDAVENGGRFLSETQLAQLRGEHPRLASPGGTPLPDPPPQGGRGEIAPSPSPCPPRVGDRGLFGDRPAPDSAGERGLYVAGIDVAGEDEQAEDSALRSLKPRKDSTAVTICAVTWAPLPRPSPARGEGGTGGGSPARGEGGTGGGSSARGEEDRGDSGAAFSPEPVRLAPRASLAEPTIHIVQHYWWTGRKHRELFPQLVDLLKHVWGCRAVVIDATGVGAGVASFLVGALPGVARPFLFTAASKSALGYGLLGAINGGRLKMYAEGGKPGSTASPESAEFWEEMRLAQSTLHENQRLSFFVDPREGHDDLLMSLALAVEAAAGTQPRVARGLRAAR
ncbi:MAG TPA: hypothetical protein VFC51_16300 [Chloroflexota bacterium]|nr:hypothetical protein [Chloroflexota bacterium]